VATSENPSLKILHTNDLHGVLSAAKYERLKVLRGSADLYFDTGDAIKTGNLGIPVRQEPVWGLLDSLGCDAGVLGNRETHVWAGPFEAKLAGAKHPILCANLRRKDGTRPLPGTLVLERRGIRIGLVGVMVPMVTERMKTQAASVYLWDPPIPVAQALGAELRPTVDLLFALTHIGHREDRKLAEKGIFDVIFGGHSHTVLPEPELVGATWICQGGSHARYGGVYTWDAGLSGGLIPLS
jgi:2',3'-cyclic-nucleotide 2'-phosphodiesterase (5'-nucleotidase family)